MPYRQKESLYKDRIFGDDETPPRPTAIKPSVINAPTEEKKAAYPFNRDVLASTRLHLQHYVFTSSLGYLLHPSIPLKENLLVADIGCGTGIWSLEMAKQLPQGSKVEAYDLNLAQAPPKNWWPDNVTFGELDIFGTLPAHLIGKFDIVHLRLFLYVIQSGNPMPLLAALLKLLKPGGYLQWQEYVPSTEKVATADPNTYAPKIQALNDAIRGFAQAQGFSVGWVEDFHIRLGGEEAGGAELVAHARPWTAKEAMILKQETMFLATREWCKNMRAKTSGDHAEAARLEKIIDEAEEECWKMQRGTVVHSQMVTWVARKKQY